MINRKPKKICITGGKLFSILGKIPFDLEIPKAMSFAKTVVDYAPDSAASLSIKKIYKKLKGILWNNLN